MPSYGAGGPVDCPTSYNGGNLISGNSGTTSLTCDYDNPSYQAGDSSQKSHYEFTMSFFAKPGKVNSSDYCTGQNIPYGIYDYYYSSEIYATVGVSVGSQESADSHLSWAKSNLLDPIIALDIATPCIVADVDTDGDGINDDVDQCKNEPETINGHEDTDGCPDTIPQVETETDEAPEIPDVVPETKKTFGELVDDCKKENGDSFTYDSFDKKCVNFDEEEDNPFVTNQSIIDSIPNGEFKIIQIDGKNVGVFVDIGGTKKYSIDGKHFYDTQEKALKPGLVNQLKNSWKSLKNLLQLKIDRGIPDTTLLVKNISSEVYDDFMKNNGKTKKVYDKYTEFAGKIGGNAAKVGTEVGNKIYELLSNGQKENFSKVFEQYIKDRDESNSLEQMLGQYNGGDVGFTFTMGEYPVNRDLNTSALIPMLEEAYQKYKMAEKLGRNK